jgi:G:T-mismatch repair DNA endonuclease (very short patch repair protein)
MLKKDKLIQEKYNGIHPICQCGCEQQTRYEAKLKDYCKWISGHQSRVAGHFGDPKAKKRVDAIISTRKAKFASGEYDYIKQAIKNRDSVELGKKISKGAKGISKPKAKGFGIGRIHTQTTKNKMSESAIQRILKTGKVKRSGLEYKFEGILELLEIEHIHSYFIKEINKIYDFYLPKYNILIEIDGDFWHCNPDTKYALPECKTQHINIKNDKFKSQWAIDNGYTLLRFWENDINNNIKQVKQILLNETK